MTQTIDNTQPTEVDLAWARKFLYPDFRQPYLLMPADPQRTQGPVAYKHALELVAAARRAAIVQATAEVAASRKTVYTMNGEPLSGTARKDAEEAFNESEEALSDIFSSFDRVFKPFRKFFKNHKG